MNHKAMIKYLISVIALGIVMPISIPAFDPKEYPENTIKENRIVQWNSRDQSISADSVILIVVSGIPFSTSAIYLREKRKIDTTKSFLLNIVGASRKEFREYFHNEVKVKDQDGLIYWIPIQDAHLNQFENEIGACGKVTLYLLWFSASKNESLELLNEFEAKECPKKKQ